MNSIQLTEEHKAKLLEMCKKLFLELQKKAYDNTVKYYGSKKEADFNYGGFYITGDNHIQCSYPIDEKDDSFHKHLIKSIHWFEFCMTHLAEKIRKYGESRLDVLKDIEFYRIHEEKHLIDHLYEEFKKLKL